MANEALLSEALAFVTLATTLTPASAYKPASDGLEVAEWAFKRQNGRFRHIRQAGGGFPQFAFFTCDLGAIPLIRDNAITLWRIAEVETAH